MFNSLKTESYKGTRDFYPEDMAIQRYIFDTWAETAESFGFERYDASVLEPAELYKSKGAENEELVNEQTYTFTDRGDREVTLRPEMTPTVARMVAGKRRDLNFPVRWYSIPNLFRYERPQRGRLREHWQLNCDMFGADHFSADVEMITLANAVLINFGATPDMFEIRINSRKILQDQVVSKLKSPDLFPQYLRLLDKKAKISAEEFQTESGALLKEDAVLTIMPDDAINTILESLTTLGITNAKFDASITRGFNYYTGVVFEIFDVSSENNRSLLGGGRYDNLTELFGGEPISGIGFGMGDVTMRDFLETHKLLPELSTGPTLVILPTSPDLNMEAEKIAHEFRETCVHTSVDISDKKIGKKISTAVEAHAEYILVLGEDEVASKVYTLKTLSDSSEQTGSIEELISFLG